MSSNPKLRVSPFGLQATSIQETEPPRQRSKHDLPCHRAPCRSHALPAASWLAQCILAEESDAEDPWETIH